MSSYPNIKQAVKKVNERRKKDPIYDLRYRLFFAMRSDLETMAHYNDNDKDLYKELQAASLDILNEYKKTFLD